MVDSFDEWLEEDEKKVRYVHVVVHHTVLKTRTLNLMVVDVEAFSLLKY